VSEQREISNPNITTASGDPILNPPIGAPDNGQNKLQGGLLGGVILGRYLRNRALQVLIRGIGHVPTIALNLVEVSELLRDSKS
jgi:hypothetical protein